MQRSLKITIGLKLADAFSNTGNAARVRFSLQFSDLVYQFRIIYRVIEFRKVPPGDQESSLEIEIAAMVPSATAVVICR